MFRGIFSIGILCLSIGGAQALEAPIHEVLPYAQARKILLERGFRPFVMPGSPSCDENDPRCYPELVGCVHKRHWICDYTWRQGRAIFQVETNSDIPIIDSFYCLVNCTVAASRTASQQP